MKKNNINSCSYFSVTRRKIILSSIAIFTIVELTNVGEKYRTGLPAGKFKRQIGYHAGSLHTPGHSANRHERCSNAGPRFVQSFPPAVGGGLEQVRCRDVTPGPQLLLHADQSVNAV